MLGYIFVNVAFEMTEISKMASENHFYYHFVDNSVESHYKKQKFCWFVSCKVFHVGLYFRDCSIWDDRKIQDGVRTTILEYCFVKHFVETAHNMLMLRLHDPTVGPTGRSNRSVQELDQQLRRVNGRPTGWPNWLKE